MLYQYESLVIGKGAKKWQAELHHVIYDLTYSIMTSSYDPNHYLWKDHHYRYGLSCRNGLYKMPLDRQKKQTCLLVFLMHGHEVFGNLCSIRKSVGGCIYTFYAIAFVP